MRIDRRVAGALKELGAVLVRSKKHLVFRVSGARNVVLSHTPSDVNAAKAQLKEIAKVSPVSAAAHPNLTTKRKEKRDKPGRFGQEKWNSGPVNNPFADQLRVLGVTEEALRFEIQQLKSENGALKSRMSRCWGCRFREWVGRWAR